jgi:hypothetical protein
MQELELMAPEGLGDELLREWAPWARDDNEGEGHSWSVKPRIDPGFHGTPPDRFFVVNRIVASHKREQAHFWAVVSRWYLGEKPVWLICRELDRPDWWVLQKACWCAELVSREYRDYTDKRRVVIAPARHFHKPA